MIKNTIKDVSELTDLLVDAAELLSKELMLHVLLPTTLGITARSGNGFTGCKTIYNFTSL